MSVLSMVALRMVTQEGPRKCLKIYEGLKENAAAPLAAASTATAAATAPDARDMKPPASSRSAKRRIRRRKLKESRRAEEITEMTGEKGTKEPREDGDETVDVAPYNLVTHADRRTSKDFLERSLMAAFLLKCLQRVGFFACPTPDDGSYRRPHAVTCTLLLAGAVFNFRDNLPGSRGATGGRGGRKNVLARAEGELSIQQILRAAAAAAAVRSRRKTVILTALSGKSRGKFLPGSQE